MLTAAGQGVIHELATRGTCVSHADGRTPDVNTGCAGDECGDPDGYYCCASLLICADGALYTCFATWRPTLSILLSATFCK